MAITDRESAEAWAQSVSQEARAAFAARCALRALPGLGSAPAEKIGEFALPVLRASLTSAVTAVRQTQELRIAARTANLSAEGAADDAYDSAAYKPAIRVTSSTASAGSWSADYSIADTNTYSHSAAANAFSACIDVVRKITNSSTPISANAIDADADAKKLASVTPQELFEQPLWSVSSAPDSLFSAYQALEGFWEADQRYWGFWQRWYNGMLNGRPMSWDLQEQVALIPQETWARGAMAVAAKIAEIETRLTLLARIEELERERPKSDRYGIGGNQPPEPIVPEALENKLTEIWVSIEDLKTETNSPQPNQKAIERIVEALLSGLKEILKFCGRMGEHAAKVAITVAVAANVTKFINPELLDAVIRAAKAWLAAL